MRNVRVGVFCYLIVALLFLAPFSHAGGNVTNEVKLCDTHKMEDQCGENERCLQMMKFQDAYCACKIGYLREEGRCVLLATSTVASASTVEADVKANSGGSSVAAGLLIPTFLVVIGVLLYLGARRYKWLQRFGPLRQNHYGNVLVTRDDEDDDDDPPIA
ncbi:hypothetical protein ANTRET_LOCUS10266 [Anthophora retusa]